MDLIAAKAADFGAVVRSRSGTGLELKLPAPLPDGRAPLYAIRLDAKGAMVAAREAAPLRLPAFCPERHINPDGSFCLGWEEAEDLEVHDEHDAENFLGKLVKYLRAQERAARKKEWPDKRAWAHGDAARHQRSAIEAAKALSPRLGEAARMGELTLVRRGDGPLGPALRVKHGGETIVKVWEKDRRVVNLRRPCICESRSRPLRIIRKCKDHKDVAVRLAFALRDWEPAEKAFWQQLQGRKCCGTLSSCPLK